MNFVISQAERSDLQFCAKLLMDIYNNNELNEGWTEESAMKTCEFFFNLNPDLFLVAKNKTGEVIGFTYSFIKPWADGNWLMIEEISVDKQYRKIGVAKALLKHLIMEAKEKYHITKVNGATYLGENNMPYAWYERINFKKVDDLFLIEGDAEEVLNSLN